MKFKYWLETSGILQEKIPLEPGKFPIPSHHIRLYHYSKAEANIIRKEGLKLSKARGHTYGEPDMVWASSDIPDLNIHTIVEFHVPFNDSNMTLEKPEKKDNIKTWQKGMYHVGFFRDIRPEEIIAVHEPWHQRYRYIKDNPDILQDVLDGKHDDLLKIPDYGKAIQQVKSEYNS